jgi:hypothetical protein
MKSDVFNWRRFLRLVRADIALNSGWILPGAAVFFWAMIVGSFFKGFLSGDSPPAPFFYILIFSLGGFFLTSRSFTELSDRRKMHGYLLLPGSMLEKYLSRYILTSWLYVAGGVFVYSLFIFLAGGVFSLFHEQPFSYSGFFKPELVQYLLYFLAVHPVFFMGSVYFNNQVLLKTLMVILALPSSLMLYRILLLRILYHDTVFLPNQHSFIFYPIFDFIRDPMFIFSVVTRWPFPALPPFLLIIGYIHLKEREAVDGI